MTETEQADSRTKPHILDILTFSGLLLFLLLLPFHLVIKKLVPGPLGTYWKEGLLGILIVLWAVRSLRARRLLLTQTHLDWAVLVYLGLLLVRFALDGFGWVGAWGLYISVLYLPLFWIVPAVLRGHRDWLLGLVAALVGVGALVALGGLLEFALNVPLWPSAETIQRQGFPDVYIYGTHIRRVYFTFDSPTTLANTLALLLPLALMLVLIARRRWVQLLAGLAAALMAACTVLTFSRGIWVATLAALVLMALVSGFLRRRWKTLLVAGGAVALIALAWGGAMIAWRGWGRPTFAGVVELSPAAYRAAPVTEVSQDLLQAQPAVGQAETQTWSLLDPITSRDDVRDVLYEHPPQSGKDEIIYVVTVPENGALYFAIALMPETWSPDKGDGASFQLHVTPAGGGAGQFVFVRYINPKLNPSDRRWRNFLVDLSDWAGQTVNLSLITEAGPAGDWNFDWAGWADLDLVRVAPGYFDSAETENAIVQHTTSVLDWARDETNRDRLAAWSQAVNAWRAAPLWGTGLGTTGAAALRTRPERAFVTESQVLKALVELGPLGLLALALLWFQIARLGYRTYRSSKDPLVQALLLGILTSLLVIFVEGLVYQNLEVKQVNAYFWTLAGIVALLSARLRAPDRAGP